MRHFFRDWKFIPLSCLLGLGWLGGCEGDPGITINHDPNPQEPHGGISNTGDDDDDGSATGTPTASAEQLLETVAGDGSSGRGGDGGLAVEAQLRQPLGVLALPNGSFYLADTENHKVRRVDTAGKISTYAGIGNQGYYGDAGQATQAALDSPAGLAADGDGLIYVVDTGNHRVRRINASGLIDTVAGNGVAGSSGDGGVAKAASLNGPMAAAVTSAGELCIADTGNHRIRCVSPEGLISTLVGNGSSSFTGDGGQGSAASLDSPRGLDFDSKGNLFIADTGNGRVRKVDTAGVIQTVAGGGSSLGDGGPATKARLSAPCGVAVDGAGDLYISDCKDHRIRRVSGGVINTVAGTGVAGSSGDGGAASAAQVSTPAGLWWNGSSLYIADSQNNRIRLLQ